jgi:tetratricopeptide (TPR) repeat protein
MKTLSRYSLLMVIPLMISCQGKKDQSQLKPVLASINLMRGDIALCGSEEGEFGKVDFSLSCAEKVRADFNLAAALLHSFEYTEAEKVFAKVIDADPECVMAYWGVAMSNFHPLWAPPTKEELQKGSQVVAVARSLESKTTRETDYLEAVALMYDNWDSLDHKTRTLKFESAAEKIYQKYPEDVEAAIFYSLALRAASDPTDKTFVKQRKAGEILNSIFTSKPDHPGVAHYLIHSYDYPELAEMGLNAARKYAAIAATSAHALHMPSHIFTRLGLWNESIQSNINSITAAKCYAENAGMKGHWDEEIHGIDYLAYAYLQQGNDDLAKAQMDYIDTIEIAPPLTNKVAYTFAAVPTRYALERKDWAAAQALELKPATLPWDNFLWEKAIVHFGRILGAANVGKADLAKADLSELQSIHEKLKEKGKAYEANQVQIQIKASEAWLQLARGNKDDALKLMTLAADMEDATDKPPVTPGEVVPARELLADMYMKIGNFPKALEAYEADLKRHAGRFNGLYGAGIAAKKSGNKEKASSYFKQLVEVAAFSDKKRPEVIAAESFLKPS